MDGMILELVSPALVIVCYCIGMIVKHFVKKIDNKYIPAIVAVLGAIIACITNESITIETIAQGIISGWASTGVHQTFKNLRGNHNG